MTRFISKSPAETKKIAADFAKQLAASAIIGLKGDLGSGKTTFVQGMAEGLQVGTSYTVNSPTFTLINEYGRLIHVDLYRIDDPAEVESLALDDYRIPGNIVVVEWAEKLPTFLKVFDFQVRFRTVSDKEREIEIL